MKKIIILLIIAIATTLGVEAKSKVAELFKGDYKNKPDVSQIVIKGNQLKEYRLYNFMSLTVRSPEDRDAVAKAVEEDARNAKAKEVTYSGGKMAYGFLTLSTSMAGNEYVFYYRNDDKAVVMYMDGEATAAQIQRLIKKTDNKKTENKK